MVVLKRNTSRQFRTYTTTSRADVTLMDSTANPGQYSDNTQPIFVAAANGSNRIVLR